MSKLKFLAAAAVVTSLAATPVLAKDAPHHADKKTVKMHKAGKQARMQRNDRMAGYGYDRGDTNEGFFPGAVAGGIVSGALNTAGAIASAPFRDDDYAYDTSYDNAYRYSQAPVYRNDDDFAPVSAAANIVGSAVNTAGAIATAPFRDTYAYDDRYVPAQTYRTSGWDNTYNSAWDNGWAGQSYAQRNGFVCTPGTTFTNSNGYRQICQ